MRTCRRSWSTTGSSPTRAPPASSTGCVAAVTASRRCRPGSGATCPRRTRSGFTYEVSGSETLYVIDGAAQLTLPDDSVIWLQEGYLASFAEGFEARWRTVEPFMKFFVVNGGATPTPQPWVRLSRGACRGLN